MLAKTKDDREIITREITKDDFYPLTSYLNGLSDETKKRFGPHAYDINAVSNFYSSSEHVGYIVEPVSFNHIIAYAIIRKGYLVHDKARIQSYGFPAEDHVICTFAPSVADEWQSVGVGNILLSQILSYLQTINTRHLVLWGGVQAGNEKAVNYYLKNGFRILGEFEHHGGNYDMVFDLY